MLWMVALALLASGEKAKVVVSSPQRIAFAPAYFKPVGKLLDPSQELQCPEFIWDWGDGCTSGWTPYCDPYERPEERRTSWVLQPSKAHVYRIPGRYEIALVVVSGDRVMRDFVVIEVKRGTPGMGR